MISQNWNLSTVECLFKSRDSGDKLAGFEQWFLSLTCCVTLGKPVNLSVLKCSHTERKGLVGSTYCPYYTTITAMKYNGLFYGMPHSTNL